MLGGVGTTSETLYDILMLEFEDTCGTPVAPRCPQSMNVPAMHKADLAMEFPLLLSSCEIWPEIS